MPSPTTETHTDPAGHRRRGRAPGLIAWAVIAAGVLHTVIGVASGAGPLASLAGHRFEDHGHVDPVASVVLWFVVAGLALVAMGVLARRVIVETGRLPVELPVSLLVVGVTILVFQNVTGAWLLLLLGGLGLVVWTRGRRLARWAR